jgi:endoglucanase
MSRSRELTALAALCVVLLSLTVASTASGQAPFPDPRGVDPAAPNPLRGLPLFVDHQQPAWRQWRYDTRKHRPHRAAQDWKIAREPKFQWFGRFNRAARSDVRGYIQRARSRHQVPLIATLRHQGRACNSHYTAGGRREDSRTRKWFRGFARAIGSARVVIAFEPDSLGTVNCLAKSRREARLSVLRYGVSQFAKLPNATVYLEGGASDWEPASRTAKLLRTIGVDKVRGFMLNVTHYEWTASNIRYGRKVSRLTGGKHFVISTAFNGRGPVHYRRHVGGKPRRINVWCNPLMRGLGSPPTTSTSDPLVDAYLWIGRPGYSGGKCNGGPLPVGTWWPKRALMFAKYATTWERPPAGTRFGLRGHHGLRAVAGPSNYP